MTTKNPKAIALRIAATIAALSVLTYLIIEKYFSEQSLITKGIILTASVVLVSYLTISFSLEKFLLDKVKLIYKSINNFKRGNASEIAIETQSDVLAEVNKDVQAWSEDQQIKIERLQSQESFRREFIGNLSHELKTPMFSIQGYILTLLDGALDDPQHNEKFLRKAAKGIDRLTALLDDLDSITNLEEGAIPLEVSEFDIVQLTKDVFDILEPNSKKENITLKLKTEAQKPEMVSADRDKITQVLTNLLVNSIKYGSSGGFTEVRFYDMDDNVLIEVKDNGVGIDEQHLDRLFERFYRVDKSRSRHIGGTGLGLAIAKHILEAHGHKISVRSKVGKGSTFSFSLTKV